MYQSPAHTSQWTPSAAPATTQAQAQWSPPPSNAQFQRPNQIPPISQAVAQVPAMQTLQPQHPEQYRSLPGPAQMYSSSAYAPSQQLPYPPSQPAPRQRTAIACRYCRRRKIRCSGFDTSEDGRCTHCQRFQQECVFTPVNAQTQAFVPAHTVWRGQGPPPNTQLYGAYGQPLPQPGDRSFAAQPQGQSQGQQNQQGQSGQSNQQGQQQGQQYPPPPQGYQQSAYATPSTAAMTATPGDKRADEPNTPTLPSQSEVRPYDDNGDAGRLRPAMRDASTQTDFPGDTLRESSHS
ncbi:hypothetical protein K470DRAFT_260629 [Piedraia hortae CBS 480.64]|uniref:Zn(2)-C6 fungal-type domain-containing protein n=1 Tax=Piedraia hortae CBS 480.64 TaxID=1314780 RepID=A0A6A7BRR9_9PEZI|nr:hypothetical protein K470DRAFT_260629 [Piedraia hortae CBS 480.64]